MEGRRVTEDDTEGWVEEGLHVMKKPNNDFSQKRFLLVFYFIIMAPAFYFIF